MLFIQRITFYEECLFTGMQVQIDITYLLLGAIFKFSDPQRVAEMFDTFSITLGPITDVLKKLISFSCYVIKRIKSASC